MGITVDQYEVNETLTDNDLAEVYQPGSAGVRREKKATLETMQEYYIGGLLDRVGRPRNGLATWSSTTNYTTLFQHLLVGNMQFVNINTTGNLDKNPFFNPDFWWPVPSFQDLLCFANKGKIIPGGLSVVNDRSSGNYATVFVSGQFLFSGTQYNFYRVALDGTQVTGNSTLNDTVFKVGQTDEYPFLNLIAPDSAGTRTLLDVGDYVSTPQSSGGDADTLGQLVEDRMQGHRHNIQNQSGSPVSQWPETAAAGDTDSFQRGTSLTGESIQIGDPRENLAGDGTPRTGSTTHGKRFTEGVSYIIVMVQA